MSYKLKWRLIDSGTRDAIYNMAIDEAIAVNVKNGDSLPTLRLYGWSCPSVSLGSFQKISDIDLMYCITNNIPVVRRPTGGRGILHGDELTYSFSARNEGKFSSSLLDTYRKLSMTFQLAINTIGLKVEMKTEREKGRNLRRSPICFNSTSYGELSYNGKKLVGSAQKRWSNGFLQQGSIPYSIDYEKTSIVFKTDTSTQQYSGQGMSGLKELLNNFDHNIFKRHIRSAFEQVFNIILVDSVPSPEEQEIAHLLSFGKYQNPQWTQGTGKSILSCNNNAVSKKALQD